MVGQALTVFQGTKPEPFKVRVVSVMHNFLPKQDIILIRAEDPRVEFSGIVAGMSGSPVYIDGKLVGRGRLRLELRQGAARRRHADRVDAGRAAAPAPRGARILRRRRTGQRSGARQARRSGVAANPGGHGRQQRDGAEPRGIRIARRAVARSRPAADRPRPRQRRAAPAARLGAAHRLRLLAPRRRRAGRGLPLDRPRPAAGGRWGSPGTAGGRPRRARLGDRRRAGARRHEHGRHRHRHLRQRLGCSRLRPPAVRHR